MSRLNRRTMLQQTLMPLGAAVLSRRASADAALDALVAKFNTLKWIAYSPTHYDPQKSAWPSEADIKDDIELLVRYRIKGIVTYGCNDGLKQVPRIARENGIEGVVAGIYDLKRGTPAGDTEWNNALAAAPYVDGYCAGNEGLYDAYSLAELQSYIAALKKSTGKPVTTTEQQEDYADPALVNTGDWIFPNVHPFWHDKRTFPQAIDWTVQRYNWLVSIAGGKFVMIKETGFPTAGDPDATENNQRTFWETFQTRKTRFCYFEAFDQPWKTWRPVEPYWGFFDKDRKPKKAAAIIMTAAQQWKRLE